MSASEHGKPESSEAEMCRQMISWKKEGGQSSLMREHQGLFLGVAILRVSLGTSYGRSCSGGGS